MFVSWNYNENGLSLLKNGLILINQIQIGVIHMKKVYILHQIMRQRFYAGKNGIVISLNINTIEYHLNKMISPSIKK